MNLRNSREILNLTQIEVAKIMNVNNSTVSGWETGKDTIPLEQLINYANIFKFSLDYLFGLSKTNDYNAIYNIDLVKIGLNLKKIRTKNGFTLESIANMLNTTKSTIWAYENGKHLINTSFLFALTNIYNNFSINELFNYI
jgi:transcriptional regulator with XRE-family HTH domain